MIEGYEQFKGDGECCVLVADAVRKFLEGCNDNDRKHVLKIGQILEYLINLGPQKLNNTEQFRREGKFPSGQKGGHDIAVYAVKAFQLRVYGGFLRRDGRLTFVCVEATKKKKNKADQSQLRRVAKALGEIDAGD